MMQRFIVVCVLLFALLFECCSSNTHNEVHKRSIISPRRKDSFVPLYPHECDSGLCNKTVTYPRKYLRRLLRKYNYLSLFSGTILKTTEEIDLRPRWFDKGEIDENMCGNSEYFAVPTAALNVNNEWKFIVQIGNITQQIGYQKCHERARCYAQEFMPHDFKTGCRQHKVIIKLLTLHANGTMLFDEYPVPGGCACVYART